MRANSWHGKEDLRLDERVDPTIVDSPAAIVRVTPTATCGFDLGPQRRSSRRRDLPRDGLFFGRCGIAMRTVSGLGHTCK
jgi:threonine dehydrogenase-like Zn-dependent dehydrogenase